MTTGLSRRHRPDLTLLVGDQVYLDSPIGRITTDLGQLLKVFKEDIPYGEELYDFISHGYELRISLIHAEPKWTLSLLWMIFTITIRPTGYY